MLGHREAGERDTRTSAGNFVHLPEDERGLRKYSRLFHFLVQVVSFTGSFTDTGKDRVAFVDSSHVADELLKQDGLPHSSAAEETYLSSLNERRNQVNDLDAGLKDRDLGGLLGERRGFAMNREACRSLNRLQSVNRVAKQVEHSPQNRLPHRHRNRRARVGYRHSSLHAIS